MGLEPFLIESEVLNLALAELDVVIAERVPDALPVLAREREHVVVHVDADDAAFRPHHLRRDITNLAATASKVENRFSGTQVLRRVPAAVVPLEDLFRNHRQVSRVVVHGTAELSLSRRCRLRVARLHGSFGVHLGCHHQKLPLFRSFAGRISRQVVHHPCRIVSMNSTGRPSCFISSTRLSWS